MAKPVMDRLFQNLFQVTFSKIHVSNTTHTQIGYNFDQLFITEINKSFGLIQIEPVLEIWSVSSQQICFYLQHRNQNLQNKKLSKTANDDKSWDKSKS